MTNKLMIIKCPKCNYEGNINCYGDDTYFKIYERDYGASPMIKCPKCGYSESIM